METSTHQQNHQEQAQSLPGLSPCLAVASKLLPRLFVMWLARSRPLPMMTLARQVGLIQLCLRFG